MLETGFFESSGFFFLTPTENIETLLYRGSFVTTLDDQKGQLICLSEVYGKPFHSEKSCDTSIQ